ncbi:MAG: hypothetical protein JW889_11395 [Verrucomicrobia bacterium]|nr:hypothetical protein [Verrucomicrobiota bacterium]
MSARDHADSDDTIQLVLTAAERDALLKEAALFAGLEDKFKLGVAKAGQIEFRLTLDELDDLQGYIATAANRARSAKMRTALDSVFDKISNLLDEDLDEDID